MMRLLAASRGPESATIRSGVIFNDTDGNPVHAHGAGLLLPDRHPAGRGGRYYMVGTSVKKQPDWLSEGVNMYSSLDLAHWRFEGVALRASQLPAPRIERPKILFNRRTATYVMYLHLDDAAFTLGQVAVCTSRNVTGPYGLVAHFQPDGKRSLDQGLFQDDDGHGYLVRSVDNKYVGISQLSDDYLRPTGIVSVAPLCEGVAMWRDGERVFLLGSHLTGWAANAAILQTSHVPPGQTLRGANWTVLGNPSGSSTTFGSQSTYVLPYAHPSGERLLIYLGDRWNANGPGSVGNSSYVWLPLVRDRSSATGFSMLSLGNGTGDGSWRVRDYVS